MKRTALAIIALVLIAANAGAQGIAYRPSGTTGPTGATGATGATGPTGPTGTETSFGQTVKHASVRVTSSDVLSLNTSPKVLVAAVAGHTIAVVRLIIYHEAGTVAYGTATGLEVVYNGPATSIALFPSANGTFTTRAFQQIQWGPGTNNNHYTGMITEFSSLVARSVILRANGANPTSGDYGYDVDVWYVEVPSPDINMTGNPGFTGAATQWTLGAGGGAPDWAYSSNTVTHGNGGGTSALQPSTALTIVAGHTYRVTFTISSYTAGSVTPSVGGTAGTARSSAATFTETLVASTTGNLLLTPTTTFNGAVDDVFLVDTSAP